MRTSMKALLAAAGTVLLLGGCATYPYDYAYGYDDGYPAYGSYGYYGYDPGYYYGPSVVFGGSYYDRGHDRDGHWRHRGDDGRPGPSPSGPSAIPCCGPGTGPGGSVTQRDADRWGAGG